MISREGFILLLDSLRSQYCYDVERSEQIGIVFGVDLPCYNTSFLSNGVIGYLRTYFPLEDDFCEIEHYCYYLNFGRIDDGGSLVFEDSGMFYDRLISKQQSGGKASHGSDNPE